MCSSVSANISMTLRAAGFPPEALLPRTLRDCERSRILLD
jgi:hypothetical protein